MTVRWNFRFKRAGVIYTGELDETKQTITGKFEQGGLTFDLELKKGESPYANRTHLETWRGVMSGGGNEFDFQIRLYENSDKELFGILDSISEGGIGLPLEIEITDNKFQFDLKLTQASYEGEFDAERSKITGRWKQRGAELDLDFLKKDLSETYWATGTTNAPATPNRPQHPKEPYPYQAVEVTFSNPDAAITLAGTLTIPKGEGPFAAAILISGSGPQDRDESLLGHKPFLVISDYLTRNGIAVLRFDERGVAESEGDFLNATSEDFAADVQAGF